VLILHPQHLQAIQRQAEGTYPEECCGLLLGKIDWAASPEGDRIVAQLQPLENQWQPQVEESPPSPEPESDPAPKSALSKNRRYWVDPQDLFTAQRQARAQGLDIIGVYHSHPDHEAVPSECDRSQAWPAYTYPIVSVHQGKAVDMRCWLLDDRQQFQPERMRVAPPSSVAAQATPSR
jgi:proteasome lid subunit RPN8/RPN11